MSNYRKKLKKLERELDVLWSEYIRKRDYWSCQRCHKNLKHDSTRLHGAHIIPKGRSKFLRWHPDNGVALCYECHIFWQHKGGNEVEFARLCDHVLGREKIDHLIVMKKDNPTARFNLKDLESSKAKLNRLIDELDR